jgi:parallel beta-helix repeat protein
MPEIKKDIRTATFVVAANDSLHKNMADYVCDGVDDDVEIQAAIDALPATGGKIILLEGNFVTAANITVPANTTLEGVGFASIITPTGAAITNGFELNGDNIILRDMKVILAAGAGGGGTRPNVIYATGRTSLILDTLWIVGDDSVGDDGSDARQNGIYLLTCDGADITDCFIECNKRHGVHGNALTHSHVEGCKIFDNTGNGVLLDGVSTQNRITGSNIHGNDNGVYIDSGASNNVIAGSSINSNAADGVIIDSALVVVSGNSIFANTERGIHLIDASGCVLTGNQVESNGTGGTKYSGIYLVSSERITITGNAIPGNGLHGLYIFRSSYCSVGSNICTGQDTGDGINITGDATENADYNTLAGNTCQGNAGQGIEIAGGTDANRNQIKANNTMNNTGLGIVDAGTNTIFDQVMHSIALDLTGGATDIEVFFAKCPGILAGYTILYSVATGGGAGVNIRVGRYQDGVALDDDYFDVSTSELNKSKGYSKHFVSADLTQSVIASGDTITVGTAGGKADTGEVILILEIAEMSN